MLKHLIAALILSIPAALPATAGGATVGNGVTGTSDSGGIDIGNGRAGQRLLQLASRDPEDRCKPYRSSRDCANEGETRCMGTAVWVCQREEDGCGGITRPHWVKTTGPGACR